MRKGAQIPNPLLEPLGVLIGEWETTGKHPMFPGMEVHGQVKFEWIEGGAYLRMQSEVDHPEFPSGLAIIGSDNEHEQLYMLYFDSRKVSRKYDFGIEGNQWRWWRDDPVFAQRFTVQIEDGGNKMVSKGEMRRQGKDWEGDLELTYARIK